ncbi:MAG: translocation/assembly module TamB domain-containing protein [Parachlamydiaceae bacterium]
MLKIVFIFLFLFQIAAAEDSLNSISGSMTVDAIPLSALLMTDMPVDGIVSGEAILSGDPENPQIELTAHIYNLILIKQCISAIPHNSFTLDQRQSLGIQAIANGKEFMGNSTSATGELSLSFKDGRISCSGTITSPGSSPLVFNFHVDAKLSLIPLSFHIDPKAPVSGTLSATGEISELLQLFSGTSILVSGEAEATVSLGGTVAHPIITGTCDLSKGVYEIPEIGVVLSGITAHLEGEGSALKIVDIRGMDRNGGTVTGNGSVMLSDEYPFTLDLILNHTIFLQQDYVYAVCSGPLTFKGDREAGKLQGTLSLDSGLISIPDKSSAVVNSVDVIYINRPTNAPPSLLVADTSKWPLTMEIQVSLPDNLQIEGRDLKSIWGGAITVNGTVENSELKGGLKIVDGEYLFNGNPFEIQKGTISFDGDVEKKTTLYVIASKDLDKVDVDVIARGSVKNPTISFRSNPPLPQKEILSWILFNRGSSEISQFQGTQLSESITNLKTNQQGPDVLSKIRSTLRIDRFEISRSEGDDSTSVDVEVGKYISEGVLVSVIKSDVNRIAIEAALTNRIKLQAQVGDDTEGQLLLKWKRNY